MKSLNCDYCNEKIFEVDLQCINCKKYVGIEETFKILIMTKPLWVLTVCIDYNPPEVNIFNTRKALERYLEKKSCYAIQKIELVYNVT